METRELLGLMIGDVLMAYHDDGESQRNFPVIVDGLDENGTLVDGGCYISWKPMRSEDCNEEYADELNPIPLTAEILEKNGFVQIEDGVINDLPEGIWQNDNALCGLDYNDRGLFYTFSNDPEEDNLINQIYGIIYVHELQHALRLCGLADLADNFTI